MICFVLRLTYLGTHVVVLCYHARFSWSWGRPQPWSKLYNLSALFLASEAARMWHLHIWQGIVCLTYTGHSNNSVFLGFFCHVEHCQLTTLAVSGTKACQTISGLVKTRGHLIMLRHVIGWNLRVWLLWLTGVESSIRPLTKILNKTKTATTAVSLWFFLIFLKCHYIWQCVWDLL